jgi:UDP-glucose 4-epimerase
VKANFERVLVTGGAGFIGSHVVEKLVGSGCDVCVLDNLSTGSLENLHPYINRGQVDFVEGDILDRGLVETLARKTDAVVHLAAVTSVPFSVAHPVLTNEVNVGGTLNLLKACSKSDVQRFVLVSSCAVYGEPNYLPVDENHRTDPLSPYSASKLAAEHYCQAFSHSSGLEAVILRLFNVYGPRQREDDAYSGVITRFVRNLFSGRPLVVYGDGSQTRDFVHVHDVAEAVWLALNVKDVANQAYNVGYGRPVDINGLAKMLAGFFGDTVEVQYKEPRAGDLKHSYADVTKAREALRYRPKIALEVGLQNLIHEEKGRGMACEPSAVSLFEKEKSVRL